MDGQCTSGPQTSRMPALALMAGRCRRHLSLNGHSFGLAFPRYLDNNSCNHKVMMLIIKITFDFVAFAPLLLCAVLCCGIPARKLVVVGEYAY